MVYFSTAPASLETVDPEQYAALKEFRGWCQSQGIIESFSNALDFQGKFRRHLQISLQKNEHLKSVLVQTSFNGEAAPPQVARNTPVDPREEVASSLTDEGRTLLLEASEDRGGTIIKLATLGGRFIQTNGKTFGDSGDRRSSARWEFALDQLVSAGLVLSRGVKDQVFEMSEPGYQVAEFLKKAAM